MDDSHRPRLAWAHNKSIIFLFFKRWDVKWQFREAEHYSRLAEEVYFIRKFEIFWRVYKKVKSFSKQS